MDSKRFSELARMAARYGPALGLTAWLALGAVLGAGCAQPWQSQAVVVTLPVRPEFWPAVTSWDLEWQSADASGFGQVRAGEQPVLWLPRARPALVRCRPRFAAGPGRPFGALWPADAKSEGQGWVLEPGPGGGWAVEFGWLLYQAGLEAFGFDLSRLAREAASRVADPWSLDLPGLVTAAVERRFSAALIREPQRHPVAVPGLSGEMAPESPWGTPLLPGGGGRQTVALPAGVWRWFGEGRQLLVSVAPDGAAVWASLAVAGAAGMTMANSLP